MISNVAKSVRKMTVESVYLPTITLDRPFSPGAPSPLLEMLKPKITLEIDGFEKPVVMTPYGQPAKRWPMVQLGLIVGGVLAVAGVVALLRR